MWSCARRRFATHTSGLIASAARAPLLFQPQQLADRRLLLLLLHVWVHCSVHHGIHQFLVARLGLQLHAEAGAHLQGWQRWVEGSRSGSGSAHAGETCSAVTSRGITAGLSRTRRTPAGPQQSEQGARQQANMLPAVACGLPAQQVLQALEAAGQFVEAAVWQLQHNSPS
jgi:hypothetical protein